MTRITKTNAIKIAEKIAAHKFDAKIKEAQKSEYSYGKELIESLFDVEFINSLPDGVVPTKRYVGHYDDIHSHISIDAGEYIRVPYFVYQSTQSNKIAPDKISKYKDLIFALKELERDKRNAIEELTNNILAFKTIEKLLKEWPEIDSFIEPYMRQSQTTALAVPVMALNKKYELPLEKTI